MDYKHSIKTHINTLIDQQFAQVGSATASTHEAVFTKLKKHISMAATNPYLHNKLASLLTAWNPHEFVAEIIKFKGLGSTEKQFAFLDTQIKNSILNTDLQESARHNICHLILANLSLFNQWSQLTPLASQQQQQQFSNKIYSAANYLLAEYWAGFVLCQNPSCFVPEFCVPYLFAVAGCYAILDGMIDSVTNSEVTKQVIKIFGRYLHQLKTRAPFAADSHPTTGFADLSEYPVDSLTDELKQYNTEIRWLVCKIAAALSYLPAENQAGIISALHDSFNNELDCYKKQFMSAAANKDVIMELSIDKGITAANLIIQCLAAGNDGNLVVNREMGQSFGVLMQVLDDLSDWTEDSACGISTFASLLPSYEAYILFSGQYLADFIDKFLANNASPVSALCTVLVMYWVYCLCKNLPDDSAYLANILTTLELDTMISAKNIKLKRREKHSAKAELFRVFFKD